MILSALALSFALLASPLEPQQTALPRQGMNTAIPGERKGGPLLADYMAYAGVWRVVSFDGVIDTTTRGIAALRSDGFPDFSTLDGGLGFGVILDHPEAGERFGSAVASGTFQIEHTGGAARFLTPGDSLGPGYMGGDLALVNGSLSTQEVDSTQGDVFALLLTDPGVTALHVYRAGEEPGFSSAFPFRPRELALTDSFLTPGTGHIRHMQTAGTYTEDVGKFEGGAGLSRFGWEVPLSLPPGSSSHKDRLNDIRSSIDDTAFLGKSGWAIEDIVAHANALDQPLMYSIPVGYLTDGNEAQLDTLLAYIFSNIDRHASVEYGSEVWNSQFTPYKIVDRDRGGMTREAYIATRIDKLIRHVRAIDPSRDRLKVYVGGQTGFGAFLGRVLSSMDEVCDSAGTAPYVSPRKEDMAAWKAAGAKPTSEQILDSCIANLPLVESALERQMVAIDNYEATHGVLVERIAYEGGYAYYAPALYQAAQRGVLGDPGGKLKTLYRGLFQVCANVGYDEVIWYCLTQRMLVGGSVSVFGHGETFARVLRTDPSGDGGTQTVADQHQPKAQVVREWLPQFQLVLRYTMTESTGLLATAQAPAIFAPVSPLARQTGNAVADIAHPWDSIALADGSPPLPVGVSFDSSPSSITVGAFILSTTTQAGTWSGDVVLTSWLSGNSITTPVTITITDPADLGDPSWGDNSIETGVGLTVFRVASSPDRVTSWAVVSGVLPQGWLLDPFTGLLVGTSEFSGEFTVAIQGTGPGGVTRATPVSWIIGGPPPSNLRYPNPGPFVVRVGAKVSSGIPTFDNGSGGERFSISPQLPPGLSFSASTGEVSGSILQVFPPTVYTVGVTDAAGRAGRARPATTILQFTGTARRARRAPRDAGGRHRQPPTDGGRVR